jgi:hypothetical protein
MFDKIKIIENFLTEQDFQEITSIKLDEVKDKEKKVYHNKIFKNGAIEPSCLKKETIQRLHDNYHSTAFQILKECSPEKLGLYEYSEFHIVITGKDYAYPVHTDSHNKLLSGVIYLSPKKNYGTFLYSSDKREVKNIEWKQNRGLFFSRTGDTYHSYKSNGLSNRITLIYNLMTTDIRGVCKAEKTFFPYVLLKNKLNKIFLKIKLKKND